MNQRVRHILLLPRNWLVLPWLLFLAGCGGSNGSPSVTPIVVNVSPKTAPVSVGTTQLFTATVSGTTNTGVTWKAGGGVGGNSTVGTISTTGLYKAPLSIPSPATVPVTAVSQADTTKSDSATVTVVSPPPNQAMQSFPIKLGTTGGNVKDSSIQGNTITCCSGTLGALVSRGGSQFILSNNHVLARSGQASTGEVISQPGLVDNKCNAGNTVAHLTQAAPLKTSNVDAAIAAVVSGAVDSSGAILDLGSPNTQSAPPASTPVTATVGMAVAKSGRSTSLTCSSVQSISASIQIDYQTGCGTGTTFSVTFTNQVVVNSGSFSAAGDSGSLIVNSQTAQPVALLFGGNSTNTVGNPIQSVLTALKDSSTGDVPTVVGGGQHAISCPAAAAAQATTVAVPQAEANRATAVKLQHESELMADPAVIRIEVGASDDNPGEAAIVIYVDKRTAHAPIPAVVGGVRTKVILTDRLQAAPSGEPTQSQTELALANSEVTRAAAVEEKHAVSLMSDPAVIGVGVGRSADEPSSAALVIYVDENKPVRAIPAALDGVRTKVIRTDRFRSFGWGKQTTAPAACFLKTRHRP